MARVIAALIRHGDYHQLPNVPSAHQPFPLTPKGESQSRAAAETIEKLVAANRWHVSGDIDSSNLLRAWQTASLIQKGLGNVIENPSKISGFDQLAERSVGSAANLTTDQIEQIVDQDPRFPALPVNWKSSSHFRLPLQGAESLLEAGERVAEHLTKRMTELASEVSKDTLKLFVGHGASFRHAAYHLGVLDFDQIAQLSMFHATPVCFEFSEKLGWTRIAGEWKVRSKNDSFND